MKDRYDFLRITDEDRVQMAREYPRVRMMLNDVRMRENPRPAQWVMEADQIDAMNSIGFKIP